jgi:hypothetical protein
MTSELRDYIAMKLGEVSMCWSETPKGVFQDEKATVILDEIMDKVEYEHLKDVEERRQKSQLL